MNKSVLYNLAITASLALSASVISSCTDFDFAEARGDKAREELKGMYTQSFTEVFGYYGTLYMDESHEWGFADLPTREEVAERNVTTRATADYFGYYKVQDGIDKLPAEFQGSVPPKVTYDEERYVLDYIKNNPNKGGVNFGFSDYFVQNVGSIFDTYIVKDMNGTDHQVVGGNQMDYFSINGEHIRDYNAVWGPDALITGLPFNNPTYHDSYGNHVIEDHWRLYYISGYGYYLCFDYQTWKDSGERHDGDGVHNDWVIKLSPANGDKGDESCMRIMAEDLGSVGDFDFNDVVFDVDYRSGGQAEITVHAAGGTLPLYVAGQEVHELFDVPTDVMINTGAGSPEGVSKTSRSFMVSGLTSTNPIDIPIIVINEDDLAYEIDASQGQAPGKICVPTSTRWTRERVNIKSAYTEFPRWIENKTFKFWDFNKVASNLY